MIEYKEELGRRPDIVCVTKCELPGSDEIHRRLADDLGREVLLISAVTGQGLNLLPRAIARELDQRTEV